MPIEDERILCLHCGHDDIKHYSSDPGAVYGVCRGTYQDGPNVTDICGCKCESFEPL